MKQTTSGRYPDLDSETFDQDITGDLVALYKFGQSAKADDPVPLFLSEHDDEPYPRELTNPLQKRRHSVSSLILASVLAASAAAILFALFSSDDMRDIIVDAKLSIVAMLAAPSAQAQPDSAQLTAKDIELLNDPAGLSRPANRTPGAGSVTAPSREEIASAYQSAMQSQVAAAVAPAAAATKEPPDAEQEALFKQFLAWEAERNARAQAQVQPKKAKSRPPM